MLLLSSKGGRVTSLLASGNQELDLRASRLLDAGESEALWKANSTGRMW
jgi:hypothetical protein